MGSVIPANVVPAINDVQTKTLRKRRKIPPPPESAPSKNLRSKSQLSIVAPDELANSGAPLLSYMVPSAAQSPKSNDGNANQAMPTVTHKKATGTKPKKSPAQIYRLLKSEIPSDIGGLQVQFPLSIYKASFLL